MNESGTPPILGQQPVKPSKPPLSRKWLIVAGIISGALYGLIARAVFGFFDPTEKYFEVMSKTFILGVPFSIGFISSWFGDKYPRQNVLSNILGFVFTPILGSVAFVVIALMIHWEGVICFVLWLPFIVPMSLVGALFGFICLKIITAKRNKTFCVAVVALLPFAASPLEHLQQAAAEIRTVQTQIKIDASAETVWKQIRSVPLISEREQSYSFSHIIGFPRPLEAKLVGEGVGAVRYATFEHGVLFVETINEWDEPRRLSFSIHADTKNIPPKTFDEHVTIGGKYFDVLNGTYWIEDIGNGDVILHLSSEQRLSTRFNFYSHYWTEYLMSDLQNYILAIIKKRCETP
jgi:hypothetical protein